MAVFSQFIDGSLPLSAPTEVCEYYNPAMCLKYPNHCNKTAVCDVPESGKRSHCYALWTNNSGSVKVLMKGCWLDNPQCYDLSSCTGEKQNDGQYYCCCEGDFCNSVLSITIDNGSRKPDTTSGTPVIIPGKVTMWRTLLFSLLPLIGITVFVICIFWLWRHKKMAYSQRLPTQEPMPAPLPSPHLGFRPVELIEIKARGRFGCIWRAQLNNTVVAVKVFPLQDRQSWQNEREFYSLPHVGSHDCILHFIGAEKRCMISELWLITDYHERGSLYDYLKGSTVTVKELFTIATSMCRGLAFLHSVVSSGSEKPSVAHRDIKSRNILLKLDSTACIADFGLALILNQNPGDVHGQVGTRRYMAPEVLDGSINFSVEYFLKIDVYACALVLWELLSRCSTGQGLFSDYRMPFEDEVGSHPSLEEMQEVVVSKKQRPLLKQEWYKHEELRMLCTTVEECWDQDPEARLSAECIEARLQTQLVAPSTTSDLTVSMSKLLTDDEHHAMV